VLLGPSYVARKYRQSVPPIFVRKGQDEYTGTGFLASNKASEGKRVIVTAKHNVDPVEGITFSAFGSPDGVSYRGLAQAWTLHPSVDLAAMPVECSEVPIPIYPVGTRAALQVLPLVRSAAVPASQRPNRFSKSGSSSSLPLITRLMTLSSSSLYKQQP
jgi:S1-C subfamily serine protease